MIDVVVRWAPPTAPIGVTSWLTDAERDRMARLRRAGDRDGFLAAHALARIVAAGVVGSDPAALRLEQRCPRCGEPHGPPRLPNPGAPRVSLAHTEGLVIAAAAPVEVGVDAEPTGAAPLEVARVALTPTEQRQLAALATSEQPAALARWWVRKEAVLKALQLGLDVDPGQLEVSGPWLAPEVRRWPGQVMPVPLSLLDLDLGPSHVGAIAVTTDNPVTLDARPLGGWR